MSLVARLRQNARNATSLLLIAAAAGIGAYAYFVDRGTISDSEREKRSNDVFPAYRREQVARVEVNRPGLPGLVLERLPLKDGGDPSWTMTRGDRHEVADQAAVDRLLGAFEFASIVRKVDPKDAPGLDAPRARGVLGMGRLVYHFALGAPASVPQGSAYFRVDGQGTYVITHELVAALLEDVDVLRERTLVPYLSLDLSKLVVRSPSDTVDIERMDGVSFRLPSLGVRASRAALDRVWGALGEMRAEAFVDDATADRATVAPAFTVQMTPTDTSKPPGELVVGGPCPDHRDDVVVVRNLPTRVSACAPKGILDGLATTREALVDRRLFAAHADEIEEVRLEGLAGDSRRIDMARKGSGWLERAPRYHELSGDEVDAANALAEALARSEADSVKRGEPGPPFVGRSRVTITRVDHAGDGLSAPHVDESVVLGPEEGAFATVQRTGDGAILRVSAEVARKLLPSEIAIRSRDLFEPKTDQRVPLRVASRCDGVTQEVTREDGAWSLTDTTSGARFPADVAGVLDLASAVGRAKAEAWVADVDDGTFGLGTSACSLTLAYLDDAGSRTVTLGFGREGEGGTYARVVGDAAVFVAPRSLRALASRWLVDRAGFRVDPSSQSSVTLQRGTKVAVFVRARNGQALARVDGGGEDIGERVREALAGLRAEGVVHLGPARSDEGFSPPALDVRVVRAQDAGGTVHFALGHAAVRENQKVYFARQDGVNATFAIAEGRVTALLEAL